MKVVRSKTLLIIGKALKISLIYLLFFYYAFSCLLFKVYIEM